MIRIAYESLQMKPSQWKCFEMHVAADGTIKVRSLHVALCDLIRITDYPAKLKQCSEKHANFYVKYASHVIKSLKKPFFQRFLTWMLAKEKIEINTICSIEIKLLPLKRKNGKGLVGKCNSREGKIQIFPRTLKSCRILAEEYGKVGLAAYVRLRASAALIHELLHLKYAKNEARVRELTKEYFSIFFRHNTLKNQSATDICRILFKSELQPRSQSSQ